MDNQFAADFDVTEKWRSRRLNRRCIFCVYSKRFNDKVQNIFTWNCLCKDKPIIPGIPRPFCSCFHINKKVCTEIDKVLYDGYTPSEAKKERNSKVQKVDNVNKNQQVYHAKSIKNQVDKKYIFPVKNIIANMAKWIYSQDPINHSTNYLVHKIYIPEILHLLYMNLIKDGHKLEIPADDDFYYFEYTKDELRKYLYSLVYDEPETKEFFSKLNLSYIEMQRRVSVSDPNRKIINLSSRFSGPKWEDDFIDLDALINNVVLECVKDAVAAE